MPTVKGILEYHYHLSIWEVATRWAGRDPKLVSFRAVPVDVRDILNRMLEAQTTSDLCVLNEEGYFLRDWTWIASWEDYVPHDDENWDGSREHKQILFEAFMTTLTVQHAYHTRDHHRMIDSGKYRKKLLLACHVDRDDFARWCLEQNLELPDFWYADDSKASFRVSHEKSQRIREEIEALEKNGESISESNLNQILQKYEESNELDRITRKIRYKREDADAIWDRFTQEQKDRLVARVIAGAMWEENRDMPIKDISVSKEMSRFAHSDNYKNENTVRNWINDLDPRPNEGRRGPKRK